MGNSQSEDVQKPRAKNYLAPAAEELKIVEDREFLGAKVFIEKDSRTQLPVLVEDKPVPVWDILKKIVGKDMTRVSLPVIMNEPLSAL